MTSPADWHLALTYWADRKMDGAGAQFHRILGIYAVSRRFGWPYVHTPLVDVGNQGILATEQGSKDESFTANWNRLFDLPSDVTLPHDIQEMSVTAPTVEDLLAIEKAAREQGRKTLVRMAAADGMLKDLPDSYEVCRALSPYATGHRGVGPVRIALHVRRGDILTVPRFNYRLLPSRFYIDAAKLVVQALDEAGLPHVIELHTEESAVHETTSPEYALDSFDELPGLVRRINDDALTCLAALATADVLVMSKSAFSYLAALINRRDAVVLNTRFGAGPLSHWLCSIKGRGFLDAQVRHAIAAAAQVWKT